MTLLNDNHYSTVVDLEEEAVEIDRFAYCVSDIYGRVAITYLELDKRHQLSKKHIKDMLTE